MDGAVHAWKGHCSSTKCCLRHLFSERSRKLCPRDSLPPVLAPNAAAAGRWQDGHRACDLCGSLGFMQCRPSDKGRGPTAGHRACPARPAEAPGCRATFLPCNPALLPINILVSFHSLWDVTCIQKSVLTCQLGEFPQTEHTFVIRAQIRTGTRGTPEAPPPPQHCLRKAALFRYFWTFCKWILWTFSLHFFPILSLL